MTRSHPRLPGLRSKLECAVNQPDAEKQKQQLDQLTDDQAVAGFHDWLSPGAASPAQTPPEGDWLIWLFLGGRGAGKTRAGAEWVRGLVEAGAQRIALVAPRSTMSAK